MSTATDPRAHMPLLSKVFLEVNNSGAWKTVLTFDGTDKDTCNRVMQHADALAQLNQGKFGVRLVTPLLDSHKQPLLHWTPEASWQSWWADNPAA